MGPTGAGAGGIKATLLRRAAGRKGEAPPVAGRPVARPALARSARVAVVVAVVGGAAFEWLAALARRGPLGGPAKGPVDGVASRRVAAR